jgi:hypothetical protein
MSKKTTYKGVLFEQIRRQACLESYVIDVVTHSVPLKKSTDKNLNAACDYEYDF